MQRDILWGSGLGIVICCAVGLHFNIFSLLDPLQPEIAVVPNVTVQPTLSNAISCTNCLRTIFKVERIDAFEVQSDTYGTMFVERVDMGNSETVFQLLAPRPGPAQRLYVQAFLKQVLETPCERLLPEAPVYSVLERMAIKPTVRLEIQVGDATRELAFYQIDSGTWFIKDKLGWLDVSAAVGLNFPPSPKRFIAG
jgi:hypothetical protein